MKTIVSINNNCELVASPYSSKYDETLEEILDPCDVVTDNYHYVEFIVNPNVDSNETVRITNNRDYYVQSLPKDGLYVYYIVSVLDGKDVPINYSDLYYDSENKKLILNNKAVTDIAELVPYLSVSSGAIEYKEIPIFSICKLKKCVMKLEMETMHNCSGNNRCRPPKDGQDKDFLFISLYVLENLICQERYSEASHILERITSCNSICNDSKYNERKCNCNGKYF